MTLSFSKTLYPKTALIKAAYSFTDRAYIHLDVDDNNFIIHIFPKDGGDFDAGEFENEMLAQTARYEVYRQTKAIRQLTVARALATTVIDETDETDDDELDNQSYDPEDILKDWFIENE